jgi:hypothetical protein
VRESGPFDEVPRTFHADDPHVIGVRCDVRHLEPQTERLEAPLGPGNVGDDVEEAVPDDVREMPEDGISASPGAPERGRGYKCAHGTNQSPSRGAAARSSYETDVCSLAWGRVARAAAACCSRHARLAGKVFRKPESWAIPG